MNKIFLTLTIPPSVNHCYRNVRGFNQRGRILTPAAKAWKEEAGYRCVEAIRKYKWQKPDKDVKVVVEVVAYWQDHRRRDMNNAHKLLCDALEGYLYHDDKMVLVRDIDFGYDKGNPRLEVCVYEKGE